MYAVPWYGTVCSINCNLHARHTDVTFVDTFDSQQHPNSDILLLPTTPMPHHNYLNPACPTVRPTATATHCDNITDTKRFT